MAGQPCGHPVECIRSSGADYCAWCAEVRLLKATIAQAQTELAQMERTIKWAVDVSLAVLKETLDD